MAARQTSTLQSAITSTTTTAIPNAGTYYRHTLLISTTGAWTFRVQGSVDGSAWRWLETALTVDTASDQITIAGNYPYLQLVSTRTAGAATVELIQWDSHADAAR